MQADFAWQATSHSDTVEHNLLIPCIGNTHDRDNSKGVRYTFLHASDHTLETAFMDAECLSQLEHLPGNTTWKVKI